MRFVETPIFTKKVLSSIEDEDYRGLQMALVLRPEQGKLIVGTGGLRKIRWAGKGHGKSGGYRIYYWDRQSEKIYMLYVYPKNRQEELTAEQRKLLSSIVREEFK